AGVRDRSARIREQRSCGVRRATPRVSEARTTLLIYPFSFMGGIESRAWRLAIASAVLQVIIFPLPNLYVLSRVAVAPLRVALLRARRPDTLQLEGAVKLLPANPIQGFLLGYLCGI